MFFKGVSAGSVCGYAHPALVLIGTAALVRLALLAHFGLPGETYYFALASGLLYRGSFGFEPDVPSTWIEPLYPAVLAGARLLAADHPVFTLVVQAGLASAGAGLLWRYTLEVTGNPRAALLAGGFYAVHPYFARQAVAYQCLTLVSLLLLMTAWQFVRVHRPRAAVWLGTCLGLLLLTRLSLLPLVAMVPAMLMWEGRRRAAFVVGVTCLMIVLPWVVRNSRVDGTLGAGRAGENLYVSTAPFSRQLLPVYDVDLVVPHIYEALNREVSSGALEPQPGANWQLLRGSLSHLRDRPLDVLGVKVRSAVHVFSPRILPRYKKDEQSRAVLTPDHRLTFTGLVRRPPVEEWAFSVATTILLVLGAVGVFERRRELWRDRFLVGLVVCYVVIHAVFFPTTRLVSPMYVVLMFYAGVGGARLLERQRDRERRVACHP